VGAAPDDPRAEAAARLKAARQAYELQARRFEEAKARLEATAEIIRRGRPRQEMLSLSAFSRLQARLETMPVVEQAKGILMAQERCGPDEAFDLLRRASQRANIKLHVLAAQIVDHWQQEEPETAPDNGRSPAARAHNRSPDGR